MQRFFNPKSIGIIGVSDVPENLGKLVVKNLMEFGFSGAYHAVGLEGEAVYGTPIHRSVLDVPAELDLAMILVQARYVPLVVEECGKKGIQRLVISSAGFSEHQAGKKDLEEQLLEITKRYEMRFIGPNCLAVVNMDNGLFLPFSLADRSDWRKGPVGVIAQSGTIAMHAGMDLSFQKIGVSKVASIGNKLNVDEVDLLDYYLKDPETEVIFLYLEGLSRARDLFELACTAQKPIIIHKSNISSLSRNIAMSHTTALASDEKVVDAAFEQAGIIRVNSVEEMSDCVKALLLPPPKGNRIVCMSDGGGHAVIAADEAFRNGFTLASLPQEFYDWLQSKGRADIITPTNPLDLGDIYDIGIVVETLERLKDIPEIDAVFYNLIYSLPWDKFYSYYQKFFDYCNSVDRSSRIPVYIGLHLDAPSGLDETNERVSIPYFRSIPGALKAMRSVLDAHQTRASRPTCDTAVDAPQAVTEILERALQQGKTFLDIDAYQIAGEMGVPLATQHYVSREEAGKIRLKGLCFPVAVKAVGAELVHKTEVNGVRLNIANQEQLSHALAQMVSEDALASARGFFIQEMVTSGCEMIVGGKRDPQFGPIVMVGMGGVLVELLDDIQLAVAPIEMETAERMVSSLKGFPLLKGYRGSPAADVESLCHIVKRVSDLMAFFPDIGEIDLNPVKVLDLGKGSVVVDCKVFLKSK